MPVGQPACNKSQQNRRRVINKTENVANAAQWNKWMGIAWCKRAGTKGENGVERIASSRIGEDTKTERSSAFVNKVLKTGNSRRG